MVEVNNRNVVERNKIVEEEEENSWRSSIVGTELASFLCRNLISVRWNKLSR